jgi:protein-S-isoprenylcysteine O-methyltransferase Ste14
MIAWLNLALMVVSALLCLYFYIRSAGPAALELKIGPAAYRRCTYYRVLSSVFMTTASFGYVIYYFFPLPIRLPRYFPWPWWVSAVVALFIAVPGGYLWWRGIRDAGEETIVVKKEHTLYGGIYDRIRHPQAAGEVTFWWVIAFLLHSPFLALFSFIWLPIFYAMCVAEERDLVIRYGEPYLEYQSRVGFVFPKRDQASGPQGPNRRER